MFSFLPVCLITLLCAQRAMAASDCRTEASIVEATRDGDVSFNDKDLLGGTANIDKITQVEVYAGNYWTNFVVTQICTTYLKVDGKSETLCNGRGGTLQGRVVIPEGAYLQRVETVVGSYVDWVSFRLTNGDTFGPWGGKTGTGANRSYSRGNGVIKSFLGRDGAVVDRLTVVYEVNRLYKARLQDVTHTAVIEPIVTEPDFESPDVARRNDNREGSVEQTITLELTTTKTEEETTTVTQSQEFSVDLEVTANVGFDVGVASGGVETSFSVGASFSKSLEESNSKSEEVTVGDTIPVTAPAGVMVIAELFVRTVEYEYDWEGPTICSYTYAPDSDIVDEAAKITGKMFGRRPFQEGTVVFTEVTKDAIIPPTSAPSSLRATQLPETVASGAVGWKTFNLGYELGAIVAGSLGVFFSFF